MPKNFHDPAHGANKDRPGAAKKKGGNKGIAAAKKARKRAEAEARQKAYDEQREGE